MDLTNKLEKSKIKFKEKETNVLTNFKNLRDIDNSFIEFKSANVISRFFENIEPKEFIANNESDQASNDQEKIKIDSYNVLLEELKDSIIEYKNVKNYMESLESAGNNSSEIITTNPKEKRLEDRIIESIAKNNLP